MRRQRASARKQWPLHRKGFRVLCRRQLLKIHRTLQHHHSTDQHFLRLITSAMTDTTQWRCLNCRQLRKHSATYCCNQPWQNVIDRSYIDQSKQGQGQTDPYAHDWRQDQPWGQQWRSNSPRQRVQSPRHRKGKKQNGNTPRGQSRGRGHGPPSSDQQPGKGKGKGDFPQVPQAPLPPPPMPWPGYMPMGQNMPVMMRQMAQMQPMQIAPASTTTTMQSMQHPPMPAPTMTPEQQAREQKMQELMAYLKRRGPDLPQDVSQKVHEFSKKDGAQAKKDLQTAAKALGEAKDTLEAALQARTNLISSWNTFLTDAVRTWQEYGHLFQSQETEHQERIQAAREVFTLAKQQVDEAKSALGEAIEVNDVDDGEDLAGPSNVATSEKITESMQFLTASLHQFQQRAEEIHVEVQSSLKRPRLTSPESMDANMPPPNAEASGDGSASASTPAALQPFGAAGRQ